MDAQRQRLLELMDEIGLVAFFPSEMVRRVDAFARYLKLHFSDEEQYLKANSPSDLAAHRREHEGLWSTVEQFWLDTTEARYLDRARLSVLQAQVEQHLAAAPSTRSGPATAPPSAPDAPRTGLPPQAQAI